MRISYLDDDGNKTIGSLYEFLKSSRAIPFLGKLMKSRGITLESIIPIEYDGSEVPSIVYFPDSRRVKIALRLPENEITIISSEEEKTLFIKQLSVTYLIFFYGISSLTLEFVQKLGTEINTLQQLYEMGVFTPSEFKKVFDSLSEL